MAAEIATGIVTGTAAPAGIATHYGAPNATKSAVGSGSRVNVRFLYRSAYHR